MLFMACNRQPYTIAYSGKLIQVSSYGSPSIDSSLFLSTQVYRDSLRKTMDQVIGKTAFALSKELPESPLGNFCADACLKQATQLSKEAGIEAPDICILNQGGLRASLPFGEITLGNIYELMPFDNELMIITLDQNGLDSLLDFIAQKGGAPVGGFRMTIENEKSRDFSLLRPQSETTGKYRVLTSDFLANGGDSYPALYLSKDRFWLGLKVRDALILEVKETYQKNQSINTQKDGRIRKL
jgi:2',3'-cyclic-nucleotide 2'-phosphodiesterase (5'-nucleotidase family)